MLPHHVTSLGQGNGESSSQAYRIWGKAGWMYVERKKDWESRPLGSEERVVFGAQSR